jgi:general secretion pathway protein A
MYKHFFGLQKEPFAMTPDPAFLFLTSAHREALAGLIYAILGRKGFVVLTGEAGTGKTTLLARVLQSIPSSRAQCSVVLNPSLNRDEFLELALIDFGLKDVQPNKAQRLLKLQSLLLDAERHNKTSILIVDEAHKLPAEVLEEIRLLSNFERPEGKLLQIVLAGQPELRDVLNRQDMRQLKQRIAVRLDIQPLTPVEVSEYLRFRWTKAGGADPHPFPEAVVPQITHYARGVPRLVNAICDNALVMAFSEEARTVTAEHIREVARDLDLVDVVVRDGRTANSPSSAAERLIAGTEKVIEPVRISAPANGYVQPQLERHAPPSASDASIWKKWAGKLGLRSAEIYD